VVGPDSTVRSNVAWIGGCDINDSTDNKEKQVSTGSAKAGVDGMLSGRSVDR
jgi:hypothetical protein